MCAALVCVCGCSQVWVCVFVCVCACFVGREGLIYAWVRGRVKRSARVCVHTRVCLFVGADDEILAWNRKSL